MVTKEQIEEYLGFLVRYGKSVSTQNAARISLQKFFNNFSSITDDTLREYIDLLIAEGKSPVTIRCYLYSIFGFCDYFKVSFNKKRIVTPRVSNKEAPYITKELFDKSISGIFEKVSEEDRVFGYRRDTLVSFFNLLFYSGMRISEIYSLDGDIIIEDGVYYIHIIGKGDKERFVPVPDKVKDSLFDEDLLSFIRNVSYYKIRILIREYFGQEYTPHSFRHGYITMLLNNGVDEVSIKKVAGHASYSTTLGYFHRNKKEVTSSVLSALAN